jgi:hypothetical protein
MPALVLTRLRQRMQMHVTTPGEVTRLIADEGA